MAETHLAVLFFVSLAAVEMIKLAVGRWFKKTVDTDYMTTLDCRLCRENCQAARSSSSRSDSRRLDELGYSLDLLRSIVLVIAVKVGVDNTTLSDLAYKRRAGDE